MPGRFAGFDRCPSLFSAAYSLYPQRLFTFIIFEPECMELIRIDFLSRLIFYNTSAGHFSLWPSEILIHLARIECLLSPRQPLFAVRHEDIVLVGWGGGSCCRGS